MVNSQMLSLFELVSDKVVYCHLSVPPCDQLDYETIHITKKEMEYDGHQVPAERPGFC